MMATYPGAVVSLTNRSSVNWDHMARQNLLQDEIEAIEAELGVLPKGTYATVAARLAALSSPARTVTTAYIAVDSDVAILCDASSAAFTVTLPPASGRSGKMFHIKKIDSSANGVTIDGDGIETIDGEATQEIAVQYNSISIVSDGSAWYIL